MKKSNYKFMLLGMILVFLFSSNVYSQEENIVTGKVFPAGMNAPMNQVKVKVQGDDASTVTTDGDGFFRIKVKSFPVNLVFYKETYEVQVVTVKKPSDIAEYMNATNYKKPSEPVTVKRQQNENVVTGKVFPAGMVTPMRDVKVQIKGDDSSEVITDGNGFFMIPFGRFVTRVCKHFIAFPMWALPLDSIHKIH